MNTYNTYILLMFIFITFNYCHFCCISFDYEFKIVFFFFRPAKYDGPLFQSVPLVLSETISALVLLLCQLLINTTRAVKASS